MYNVGVGVRCSYVRTYAYFVVTCNGMEMRRARVSRRKIRLSPGKLLCALNSKGESSREWPFLPV